MQKHFKLPGTDKVVYTGWLPQAPDLRDYTVSHPNNVREFLADQLFFIQTCEYCGKDAIESQHTTINYTCLGNCYCKFLFNFE